MGKKERERKNTSEPDDADRERKRKMERQKKRNRASAPSYMCARACVSRRVAFARAHSTRARDGLYVLCTHMTFPLLPIARRIHSSPFLLEIADISLRARARAHLCDVRIRVRAPITIRNSLADSARKVRIFPITR